MKRKAVQKWGGLFIMTVILAAASDPLARQALKLQRSILTIDTHCDTPMQLVHSDYDVGKRHEPGLKSSGKQDLPRMKEGGLDASFFAVFIGQGKNTPEAYAKAKQEVITTLDFLDRMFVAQTALAERALTPDDAYRIKKNGKIALFIGLENGFPLGEDLSLVDTFYRRGVRYITLTHTGDNALCASSTDREGKEDTGLTAFGRQVVKRMNELGMIVDVSHMSDRAFFDVLATSTAPVIASHSSSRAMCDSPRNLSDEMLKALRKNGGVIQLCILSDYIKQGPPNPQRDAAYAAFYKKIREKYGSWGNITDAAELAAMETEYDALEEKYPAFPATVKDAVDHIDHIVKVAGIDAVGIGTDFDGGGGLSDLRDVTELPKITAELLRRGYGKKEIEKIWGGNFMRVFRRIIQISQTSK